MKRSNGGSSKSGFRSRTLCLDSKQGQAHFYASTMTVLGKPAARIEYFLRLRDTNPHVLMEQINKQDFDRVAYHAGEIGRRFEAMNIAGQSVSDQPHQLLLLNDLPKAPYNKRRTWEEETAIGLWSMHRTCRASFYTICYGVESEQDFDRAQWSWDAKLIALSGVRVNLNDDGVVEQIGYY